MLGVLLRFFSLLGACVFAYWLMLHVEMAVIFVMVDDPDLTWIGSFSVVLLAVLGAFELGPRIYFGVAYLLVEFGHYFMWDLVDAVFDMNVSVGPTHTATVRSVRAGLGLPDSYVPDAHWVERWFPMREMLFREWRDKTVVRNAWRLWKASRA